MPALSKGSEGTKEPIRCARPTPHSLPAYGDEMPLFEKIKTIATRIYRADDVAADMKIRNQLREFEAADLPMPICMAKPNIPFPPIRICVARQQAISCRYAKSACQPVPDLSWDLRGYYDHAGIAAQTAAENIRLDKTGQIEGLFWHFKGAIRTGRYVCFCWSSKHEQAYTSANRYHHLKLECRS